MRESGLDLAFDLEARKQRHRIGVQLELASVVRHDLLDEFERFLVGLRVVNQYFADFVGQVVAQSADDGIAFPVNKEGRRAVDDARVKKSAPDGHQVFEVPLQFLRTAVDTRSAQDDAHALRNFDIAQRFSCCVSVLAYDSPRYAAGARLVRLQYDKAPGEADESGQGSALVAALFFVDLHDDVLAFFQDVADVRFAAAFVGLDEILGRDFFQGQKAMTLGAVVYERGFETWLDPRNLAFIDVGFLTFAGGTFDIEVVEALAIDHRHAQLFLLSRID